MCMWKQQQFIYESSIKTAWDNELFYSNMYPPNTTEEWIDTDKPENAAYEKDIKYTFNEYGFRSDRFDERSDINIITCGCSQTVGVGVDQHEAWPFVLKKLIEDCTGKTVSVWNLATSGASPDYVTRSVIKTLDILQPNYVFVYWPPMTRIEAPSSHLEFKSDGSKVTQSFIGDEDFPSEFVNEGWLKLYHQRKNQLMLMSACSIQDVKLYTDANPAMTIQTINGDYFADDYEARDSIHPGPKWHELGAEYYFNFIKEQL